MNRKKYGFVIMPIFLCVILYLGIDLINLSMFSYPYELREGANIALTRSFLKGANPYTLEISLDSVRPSLFYMYPFMYSLLVAGISIILPFVDLPLLHYIISFICGTTAAAIGAYIVKKETVSPFAPLTTFFLMLSCSWRGAYISAFPDTMALLMSVLLLYLVIYESKKWHMASMAILTIMIFFTKQYFVIIAVGIWIYYLISDRKKLLRYTIYCATTGIIFAIVVSLIFPLYWTYSLFFVNGSATRISVENIIFCIKQYCYIGFTFFPVLLMCFYGFFQLIMHRKEKPWQNRQTVLFAVFLTSGFFLLKLGTNDGAYLTYFLQLLIPVMIILGMICFEKYVYSELGGINESICILIIFLFVGVSVLNVTQKFANSVYLNEDDVQEWSDIYIYLNECEGQQIYYSPNLAFYAMEHNQYIYDLGQNEFVNYESEGITTLGAWKQSKISSTLFPYVDDIIENHMDYREKLLDDIHKGVYDVVVETQYLYFDRDDLDENYKLQATYELKSGTVVYWTDVWVRQ